MKKIAILILLLAQIQARGQTTLERRSINAQSGTSTVNNLNISWTLGDPVVGTTQAGSYKLTQGFQQPEVRVTIPPSVCTQYTADNTNQRCNPQTFKPFALQLGSELMKLEAVTFQKKADGTATIKGTFRDATWKLVTLNVNLSGYSTTTLPTRTGCINANTPTAGWYYYPSWSGTIQRAGQPPLSITATSPVQIGIGANTQDLDLLGLYGKFSLNSGQTGLLACKLINPVTCSGSANLTSSSIFDINGQAEFDRNRIGFTTNQGFRTDFFTIEKQEKVSGQFEPLEILNNKQVDNNAQYNTVYDNSPYQGDNFYRVKMTYLSGDFEYSTIQKIVNTQKADFIIFPNPASNEAWIDLKSFEGRTIDITMSDVAGKVIWYEKVEKATTTPHRLDLSNVQNGSYTLTIQTSGKRTIVRKLSILK